MGQEQIWKVNGLGTARETLKQVIHEFKENGIQGESSKLALEKYINRMSNKDLHKMIGLDNEAAIQILADCYGVMYAARKYSEWGNDILEKEKQEAEVKCEELYRTIGEKNRELELIVDERDSAVFGETEAKEKIKDLEYKLALYKADLFDFYEQAGKIPKHERREME